MGEEGARFRDADSHRRLRTAGRSLSGSPAGACKGRGHRYREAVSVDPNGAHDVSAGACNQDTERSVTELLELSRDECLRLLTSAHAASEVDSIDEDSRTGWSVIVHGVTDELKTRPTCAV